MLKELFIIIIILCLDPSGSNAGESKIEKEFYSDGLVKKETLYKTPSDYVVREYSELGFLIHEAGYRNNKLNGKSLFYSDDGKPIKIVVYQDGIQKQKLEFSELYKKADSYLETKENALKAENVQKKIAPFFLLAWERKLPIGISILILGFIYFIFRFHRPDHKAYFKYSRSNSSFSLEGELLTTPPRRVSLSFHFFSQFAYFVFTAAFCLYVSKEYPKALLLCLGVCAFGLYLLHKAYEKIQILKYGFIVEAEILDIQYIRKVGKPKMILTFEYDRNDHVHNLTCVIPNPKDHVSIGDRLSLVIDPINTKRFLVYKFSNFKVKKAA